MKIGVSVLRPIANGDGEKFRVNAKVWSLEKQRGGVHRPGLRCRAELQKIRERRLALYCCFKAAAQFEEGVLAIMGCIPDGLVPRIAQFAGLQDCAD